MHADTLVNHFRERTPNGMQFWSFAGKTNVMHLSNSKLNRKADNTIRNTEIKFILFNFPRNGL